MVKQEGEHTVSGVERQRHGRNHPHPPTFDARVGKRTSARATSPPGARADGVEGGRAEPRHRGRAARERGENACTCFACASLPRRSHRARERSLRAVPLTSARALAPSAISPPLPSLTLLAWLPIARAPFPPDSPSPQACSLPEPRAWAARTAPSAPRRRAPGRARPARCVAPARRAECALPRSLARSPAVTRRGYEPATLRAPRGNASTDIFFKKKLKMRAF